MDSTAQKPFSTRFLISIFIVSLLVFLLIRWDSSALLSQKIDQAAKQAGYTLTYDDISTSGLGVTLKQVHIKKAQQMSLYLDELSVSPAFSELISGALAADIQATWMGNPISASVQQDGDLLKLTNIDAMIDVSRLENLKIPAKLSGIAHLQGDLNVLQNTGQPKAGNLNLTWTNAMAGLATPEFTLGDYQVDIHNGVDENQAWPWTISGGSGVGLSGSGTLSPQGQDPQRWLITGVVDTNVDNSNPSLAMMMQGMMGSTQAKFRLSGFLGSPRTAIVR